MSGNSTDPSYLNIARVDVFHAQPMCGDIVVLFHMCITAVKHSSESTTTVACLNLE